MEEIGENSPPLEGQGWSITHALRHCEARSNPEIETTT